MRLIAWFLFISTLVLATWLLWGGKWETWFTLEGAVTWIESTGPWAWAAGIALLAADVILPVPGTVVMSAPGWVYGIFAGGKWRRNIRPLVLEFIDANGDAPQKPHKSNKVVALK